MEDEEIMVGSIEDINSEFPKISEEEGKNEESKKYRYSVPKIPDLEKLSDNLLYVRNFSIFYVEITF